MADGNINEWSHLNNTTIFIRNIQTPNLSKNANIGMLVSGIPSAFARVDLFKDAIDSIAFSQVQSAEENRNLISYYSELVDEWKGLIACLALDYANIKVKKVELGYSDGKDVLTTENVYEPKGAFGNMLLKRRELWSEKSEHENQISKPFINIIKYKGRVVGATAPETLLFTSASYKEPSNIDLPWINQVTGKFSDPAKSKLTNEQYATLHAYITHILKNIPKIEAYYEEGKKDVKIDYTAIRKVLETWKDQLEAKTKEAGFELSIASTPPVTAGFGAPFNEIFCFDDKLYGVEGTISEFPLAGGVEFDPKKLLLADNARIARLDINIREEELKNLPILVMTADVKGMTEKAYFALPLSPLGLNVFGKNVNALVGMAGGAPISSSLKAVYDPEKRTDNLEVVLTLDTNEGKKRRFRKIYSSDGEIRNQDILIWPNFISPQWNSYYMYNELPHNGTGHSYRAFPMVGQVDNGYFRILLDEKQNPVLLKMLNREGKVDVPSEKVKAEILVIADDAVADNRYKYEVFYSNIPFKGVCLMSPTGQEGGYLLINYSSAKGTSLPRDLMRPGASPLLEKVRLGIDFGSTNTSIAYANDSTGDQGQFEFKNQRVSLLAKEMPGRSLYPKENQIFFFQGVGTPVKSNAIKSVLTLHDNRRLPSLKTGQDIIQRDSREVVGGFPSFADNLPFYNSNEKTITLNYPNGVGEVTQIHNMKWESNDQAKAQKTAFLKTLLLQVYASLFDEGKVPESIKWSYPSSMSGPLLNQYQLIWDSLNTISPVTDVDGKPYKLSISKYQGRLNLGNTIGKGGFNDNDSSFGENKATGQFGGGFGGNFGGDNGLGRTTGFGGGFGNGGFGGGFGGSFTKNEEPNPASQDKKPDETKVPAEEFLPDDPARIINYEPVPLYSEGNDNPSLSEAEAVANFISVKYGTETNVLNLCFDVGGSTTDISALYYLDDKGVTMIKQNSIRFAAQRVSQSVTYFPDFKKVLTSVCGKYGIQMVGLNFGNDTYNAQTASYFFDQIVNRLDGPQLEDLYKNIAANCPQLMCVNLYVTGLLMFYAGQLANKLIDDLTLSKEANWDEYHKPNVRVTFAGKGSRIFQWLNTINPGAAHNYYGNMFVMGYGETQLKNTLAGWQAIVLPSLNDPDIKYEVSKGLAKGSTNLLKPKNPQAAEIIGESGFEIIGKDSIPRPLDFTNSLTPNMISEIGIRFKVRDMNSQAKKFTEFCSFFYQAANQLFGWNINPDELEKECRNMSITAYVQNMPEFRSAEREVKNGKAFDFVAPIIILEGMKFYDNVLMKLLKQ